ncbi:MAG TPA: hypothetical protein VFN72_13080 [Solirubrobacterales bacterium]|nr:hypothetical protein [Solirubrobacterales bacterium]
MSRSAGTRTTLAALAVTAALLIPASQAGAGGRIASAGDGPVATKSGAIVNFLPAGKLKVAKTFQPLAICAVNCDVTGTAVIKGFGLKLPVTDSGSFAANQPFGLKVTVQGQLLTLMKQKPGKFRLNVTYTATDPTTGATDTVSRPYKFKRGGKAAHH